MSNQIDISILFINLLQIPSPNHLLLQPPHISTATITTTTENRTQKLERIADDLLSLTKLERYDYSILFGPKLGLHKYGLAILGLGGSSAGASSASAAAKVKAEKTAFVIKLEKFDAAAKIKILKEVRSFTDYGLKEAKDLEEKAPVVLKKGVTKEEGNAILEKFKCQML